MAGNSTLLHCADMHLDLPFVDDGLDPETGQMRRSDLRACVGRIVDLALQKRVDAVTIAGDLFDQDYVMPDTMDYLRRQFERLAPIQVIIAPGDRDGHAQRSPYELIHWPKNVHVFLSSSLSMLELDPGLRIWGASCPPAGGGG